jgi:hypothetical protein
MELGERVVMHHFRTHITEDRYYPFAIGHVEPMFFLKSAQSVNNLTRICQIIVYAGESCSNGQRASMTFLLEQKLIGKLYTVPFGNPFAEQRMCDVLASLCITLTHQPDPTR